jgi:hypothetical protein
MGGGETDMHKTGLLALSVSMLFFQCSARNEQPYDDSHQIAQQPIHRCDLKDFTKALTEHIIDEIEQPFLIRTVEGKIANAIDREWAEDSRVLFEMKDIERANEIRRTYADKYGVFEIRDVPEGRYCFKATVNGWDSVMGVIIVSKKADPQKQILFEMRLGT